MLKYISSFFWKEEPDLTIDEVYKILNEPDEPCSEETEQFLETEDKLDDNYDCVHKFGFITAFKKDVYSIDDAYTFKSNLEKFEIGAKVSYYLYSNVGKVQVSNVTLADDWDSDFNSGHSSWCLRKLICQVIKRNGRELLITPGELTIDLNSVFTEFIPVVGDWIEIEAKVEVDENVSDLCGKILQVDKINPLRPKVLEGRIRQWCSKSRTGVIDTSVFFMGDALVPGYIPVVGDKVMTEVIESIQEKCSWRSLTILLSSGAKDALALEAMPSVKYETNVENVCVSDNIYITADRLGQEENFSITVENKSSQDLFLLNIALPTKNISCKLLEPAVFENIVIRIDELVTFKCACTLKSVGTTRELVLFSFESFKIGRWITVELKSNLNNSVARYGHRYNTGTTNFKMNNSLIRGQKMSATPRFVAVRLPDYAVPQKLLSLVTKYCDMNENAKLIEELRILKPCLTLPFSFNIYEDRFHTLVHLEEISEIIALNAYKQDQVCLIKNGEFLMLEIENLSEKRPSLIVGDKIIAKRSYQADATEFEGVIHKIAAKHVYIKFASMFHAHYNGDEMAIMVVSSRSSSIKTHRAIGLVMRHLGSDFLFPKKVVTQEPQVKFTYEKYSKPLFIESTEPETNIPRNLNVLSGKPKNTNKLIIESMKALRLKNKLNNSSDSSFTEEPKSNNDSESRSQSLLKKLEWFNKDLNYYQKEAVRNILIGEARPLPYFIFGPPGTGKTVTLVEIILQLLRFVPHSRLLVATPSNSAANVLALRLLDSGVLKPGDLVRLVAYRIVLENSLPPKLVPYSATADISREGTRTIVSDVQENGIKIGMNSSTIGRHRITVGTCGALGTLFSMNFSKGHFTHVIVDEAAQLTEPEIMIPLAFLDKLSGQAILAGDPLQLGPVICSRAASQYGLIETFMDRMLSRFPYLRDVNGFPETDGLDPRLVTKLLLNYRSLPNALTVFNNVFYEGRLLATISPRNSPEARLLNKLTEILPQNKEGCNPSFVFHGIIGVDTQTFDSPSWFNPDEAAQLFFYVNELYRLGLKSSSVAIISPYQKQVRIIKDLLIQAEFEIPKIGTVEDLQGQEYDVVLLSTVRSDSNLVDMDVKSKLGFIFSPKRINVSISRAKVLTIVLGNPNVLCRDVHWRSIIQYCIENGSYIGCDYKICN